MRARGKTVSSTTILVPSYSYYTVGHACMRAQRAREISTDFGYGDYLKIWIAVTARTESCTATYHNIRMQNNLFNCFIFSPKQLAHNYLCFPRNSSRGGGARNREFTVQRDGTTVPLGRRKVENY